MLSKKPISADNQQERIDFASWVVGYVDGEGCFSVSIIRNSTSRLGWQVFPEFVVTQGAKSLNTLEDLKKFFQCGSIVENKRKDNHKESLYKYCVRSNKDLQEIIIPFFNKYKLRTAKKKDFKLFVKILSIIEKGEHLKQKGLFKIASKIEKMNRQIQHKFQLSSETIRQAANNKKQKI